MFFFLQTKGRRINPEGAWPSDSQHSSFKIREYGMKFDSP
jgi:hypothetical protein